jgi:hypothetical protein
MFSSCPLFILGIFFGGAKGRFGCRRLNMPCGNALKQATLGISLSE